MARYIKDFQTNADPQAVHLVVNQYLQSEGYEYINYDGENVFKKGNGVCGNPTFFKFSYSGNVVRMETWMKYAFFPGVYIGELGLTGFVGCAVKGPWKRRIEYLENTLEEFAMQTTYYPHSSVFCTGCGTQLQDGTLFCSVCGQKRFDTNDQSAYPKNTVAYQQSQMQTSNFISDKTPSHLAGCPISRKEFIDKYAPPSLRTNITSIAILCYVCAGLTFIVSCLLNPMGIIDALVLAGLALGMHLAKSKVCAILILILSIFEVVLSLAVGSFPIWWLVAGVSAVVTFNKIDKQYKNFIENINQ